VGTTSSYTPERGATQANAIRRWQPWKRSTGPRAKGAKARSSGNADKGIAEFEAHILIARLRLALSSKPLL
jgi:hypothetical protein